MARQAGANQYRGKREGYCGYAVKGKQGLFVRSINPNMSERVKTESNFENTRKYATRFQYINLMKSGQVSRLNNKVYSHGRSALTTNFCKNPAELEKKLYHYLQGILSKDSTSAVGEQHFTGTDWQNGFRNILNKNTPNIEYTNFISAFGCYYVAPTSSTSAAVITSFGIASSLLTAMKNAGFTNVFVSVDVYSGIIKETEGDTRTLYNDVKGRTVYTQIFGLDESIEVTQNSRSLPRHETLELDGDDAIGSAVLRLIFAKKSGTTYAYSNTAIAYKVFRLGSNQE